MIRPDDLRAFQHQLSGSIGTAHGEEEGWEFWSWQDRFTAAGTGSVEDQIIQIRARHPTMLSLDLQIARTPSDVTLADVKAAPRRKPERSTKSFSEASAAPIAAHLALAKTHPALTLEVLSLGRLSGGSVVSMITPHIEKTVCKAPQPKLFGLLGLLIGASTSAGLLAFDLISPTLALILIFVLGVGCLFGGIRAGEWLFPSLELLPDAHSKTRWQKTVRLVTSIGGLLVGITGIAGFILALNQ